MGMLTLWISKWIGFNQSIVNNQKIIKHCFVGKK
jgi:hypothetical protein